MSKQHVIDTTRGADRRAGPRTSGGGFLQDCHEIASRYRATKRLKNIFSMLCTGWLPWGVKWDHDGSPVPGLLLSGRRYIMCCGHVLTAKEAQALVDVGLLMEGPPDPRDDTPRLVITDAGRNWLASVW